MEFGTWVQTTQDCTAESQVDKRERVRKTGWFHTHFHLPEKEENGEEKRFSLPLDEIIITYTKSLSTLRSPEVPWGL